MAKDQPDGAKKSFKQTLNLPQTEFPIRANPKEDDQEMLHRWQHEDLYSATFTCNEGNPKYILHDGPPYANGHIHLGHAYNKILKDIVGKSRRMVGYHTPITPGWDCHGLPIEIKVVGEEPGLAPLPLIAACRAYAEKWIDIQRTEFKELGVFMDWSRPYLTMSKSYEAATVRAFGQLVQHGFIERKNKTVPWCAQCQTVLATAEIEHQERKDPSIYVGFGVRQEDAKKLAITDKPVKVIVWTTTPWTLPLNMAVLAKPEARYSVVDLGEYYALVGQDATQGLCDLLNIDCTSKSTVTAEQLEGLAIAHPFLDKEVPVLLDESVSLSDGTAFVHCAPGCGPLDYEIGVKNGLDVYSPVSADGKYTDLIEPQELVGMEVADGQWWVLKKLKEQGALVHKGSIKHSYPHCWRCRTGLIFRATPQWFFDLERDNIKRQVLDAIDDISFTPEQGSRFLRATIENRWEWCLSRQRVWGTPIPAILCVSCDKAYLEANIIEQVAKGIEQEGIEYWRRVELSTLISQRACKACGGSEFKKEYDILDVWLDSGVSNYAVLFDNKELAYPADLYLEGTDQYRGWFQSSLIMSMVINREPCTKGFMTHGFTVDEHGHKMSKSLGNVVSPKEMIDKLGTDGLRLWVASIGHENDAVVSKTLMQHVQEVHRKIRNTCRFLLSNLHDFSLEDDACLVDDLLPLDHYALMRLEQVNGSIIGAYMAGDFTRVFHELAQYTSVELSSYYLDIVKDRLYCEAKASHARRSAQTALWVILDTLTRLIAPIMSFAAEQISDHYQIDKQKSIHLQPFIDPDKLHTLVYRAMEKQVSNTLTKNLGQMMRIAHELESRQTEHARMAQWQTLADIRSVLLKAIEQLRADGTIKQGSEADLEVYLDTSKSEFVGLPDFFAYLAERGISQEQFFREFMIVSSVSFAKDSKGLDPTEDEAIYARVTPAAGTKCPRCWLFDKTKNVDGLCHRCEAVLAASS